MGQRRPQADDAGNHQHRPHQRNADVVHAPLQVAGGAHHQPGTAKQRIGNDQRQSAEQRERRQPVQRPAGIGPILDRQAADECTKHHALEEGCDQRAADKGLVPDMLALADHLEAELERHAAEDQPHQHEDDRQIERGQHHRIGQRKRGEQPGTAEYQPGLVAVPDRRDGVHHHVALRGVLHEGKEDADAEIETVHHHVHHDAEDDDHRPDQ